MKKKEILVIVLAFILAFIFANFVMNNSKYNPLPIKSSDKNDVPIEVEMEIPVTSEVVEQKLEDNKNIKIEKTNYRPESNAIKKTEIKEEPKLITEQEEVTANSSNVVIINEEYRSDAPAKYSFKGYGILDKVSD